MLEFAQGFRDALALGSGNSNPGISSLRGPFVLARLGLGLGSPKGEAVLPPGGPAAAVRPPAARHTQRRRSILQARPSFLRKTCGLIRPPASGSQNHPGTRTPRGGGSRAPCWLWQLGRGPPAWSQLRVWGPRGRGGQRGGSQPQAGWSFPQALCSPSAWAFPLTLPELTWGGGGGQGAQRRHMDPQFSLTAQQEPRQTPFFHYDLFSPPPRSVSLGASHTTPG